MYCTHRLIHLEFLRSSEWEGEHSEVSATGCVRSGCPGCLHSIALCAPTASYCRQLAKVVLNSLQVAGRWTQPVSHLIHSVVVYLVLSYYRYWWVGRRVWYPSVGAELGRWP